MRMILAFGVYLEVVVSLILLGCEMQRRKRKKKRGRGEAGGVGIVMKSECAKNK